MSSKRRHAGSHTIRQCILPEVGPPSPSRDGQFNWVITGVDPHRSMPNIDKRPNITGLQLIHSDCLHDGLCNLLLLEGHLHHADMSGIEQPIDMLLQPENREAGLSLVTTNPLEESESIMERMGHHVDVCVRAIDEGPVHPNFSLWFKRRQ